MPDDSRSSFSATLLGALEGAVSVLLTLFAGYVVARRGSLDRATVHKVSNLCSMLFLPMLIIVQMGPELTVSKLSQLWIIPVWGFVSTVIAHLVGWLGQKLFSTRSWVVVACGRPNSSALPLLLLQALSTTGVLDQFSNDHEESSDLLKRAQSLILLNVVVQQTFTFQFAPWLMNRDGKADKKASGLSEDVESGSSSLAPTSPTAHAAHINPIVQDGERVGLLNDHDGRDYGTRDDDYAEAIEPIADQPDIHWPKRLARFETPLKKVWKGLSAPLIGAIIALMIGVR